MASNSTDSDSLNFHRLVSVIIDIGSGVLRKLLTKYALLQTTSLNQLLSNNKVKLHDMKLKKQILNQTQINLLFPSSGQADIASFDMTLLNCLLQNICGQLSPSEDANLNVLRKLRNEIVGHVSHASVDDKTFKDLWAKSTKAITALSKCAGDKQYVQNVRDDVDNLSLRPTLRAASDFTAILLEWHQRDHQVAELISELGENIKERDTQIMAMLGTLPKFAETKSAFDDIKQEEERQKTSNSHNPTVALKKSSKDFISIQVTKRYVTTALIKEVERILLQEGSVIISGSPGEGKTFTGSLVLANLFNTEKCVVIRRPKDWKHIDLEQTNAIFIDDIFGILQLDDGLLSEWLLILDMVIASIKERNIKLVISSRFNILKECASKLERYGIFRNIVELSSAKLTLEEKTKMLANALEDSRKVLDPEQLQQCAKVFTSPIGFPFCCHLFCTNDELFKRGSDFFKTPYKFFCDDLRNLEKEKLAALALLLHKDGKLHIPYLSNKRKKDKLNKLLKEISESLGMRQSVQIPDVLPNLELMTDTYVTCQDECFEFIHQTVPHAVSILYGRQRPEVILRLCSSDFLHQCVYIGRPASSMHSNRRSNIDIQEKLFIPRHLHKELGKRLISEITKKKEVIKTASHPAFRDTEFLGTFMQCFRNTFGSKNKAFKFFTTGQSNLEDDYPELKARTCYRQEFVFRYLGRCKSPDLLLTFIREIVCSDKCRHIFKYFKQRCWKCIQLNDILNYVCESGSLPACKMLFDTGAEMTKKTLLCAVAGGNVSVVQETVNTLKLLNQWNSWDLIDCLMFSCEVANIAVPTFLMESGVQPDKATLNAAITKGNFELVKEIVKRIMLSGTWKSDEMGDCLNESCKLGHFAISTLLMNYGTLPTAETLLSIFDTKNEKLGFNAENEKLAKAILEKVMLSSTLDRASLTKFLESTCARGNLVLSLFLLEKGAIPSILTIDGALESGNIKIVQALMERIRKDNLFSGMDMPHCLHIACTKGDLAATQLLLDNGIEPSITAVRRAISSNNPEVVRAVIEKLISAGTWDCKAITCGRASVELSTLLVSYGVMPSIHTIKLAIEKNNEKLLRTSVEKMQSEGILRQRSINGTLYLTNKNETCIVKMDEVGDPPLEESDKYFCSVCETSENFVKATTEKLKNGDSERYKDLERCLISRSSNRAGLRFLILKDENLGPYQILCVVIGDHEDLVLKMTNKFAPSYVSVGTCLSINRTVLDIFS